MIEDWVRHDDRAVLPIGSTEQHAGLSLMTDAILAEQCDNVPTTLPQLNLLRDLAGTAVERLRRGEVDAVGEVLRQSWEAKRELASGVSNVQIDTAVERALEPCR